MTQLQTSARLRQGLWFALLLMGGVQSRAAATATITVTPSGPATVNVGSTAQYKATIYGSKNLAVTWAVNGIAGGSAATGTISASGLYTPPATVPEPNEITVGATTVATPTASKSLNVTILDPVPVITSAVGYSVDGGQSYLIDVEGLFMSGAVLTIASEAVPTTVVSGQELTATLTGLPAKTTSVVVAVQNPNPGSTHSAPMTVALKKWNATPTAAARLLDQATFGPTSALVEQVETLGINGFLTQQFGATATLIPVIGNPAPAPCNNGAPDQECAQSSWFKVALTGTDQLRQRVAFALSEIWVTSGLAIDGRAITPYLNVLAKDAFANYRTLMEDITLSPAMGLYLNMLNSDKPGNGQIANENYAREMMQLFTTGIYLLNEDGSRQVDSNNNPIPVYSQSQVQAFARAYTGWTFATAAGKAPASFPNWTASYNYPMVPFDTHHDMTAKAILNGVTLPAGQTAEEDLTGALDNIFNHPNVGPFIGKQLIQHLVKSNPSPAYVERVAAVFANNGQGVRGDLKAVVQAILTDTEARAGDTNPADDGGHLREPILWVTAVMRSLGVTAKGSSYLQPAQVAYYMGQSPLEANSVFSFFPPSYVLPGTSINAPEFAIENTGSVIPKLTMADSFVQNWMSDFTVNFTATGPLGKLAASSPGELVDALSVALMHGQMPADMRSAIVSEVAGISGNPAQRVRVAVYLVITSSAYKVNH